MSIPSKMQTPKSDNVSGKKPVFIIIGLVAIVMIAESIVISLPSIQMGFRSWPEYLDLKWAHQENLIQVLINFFLMMWLSVSALYFGGWLLNRSIRKLRGKNWSLETDNPKLKKFFPPILPYLKLSCMYLIVILMFVILQYPLQFIMYSN